LTQNLSKKELPIGDLLVEFGLITTGDLNQARRIGRDTNLPIGRVLVMSAWIDEQQLQMGLEAQTQIREGKLTLEQAKKVIDTAIRKNISFEQAAAEAGASSEPSSTKLGDLLVAAKFVTERQLRTALETSSSSYLPLGRTLVLSGVLSEELMTTAINAQRMLREGKMDRAQALQGMAAAKARNIEPSSAQKERPFYKLPPRNTVRLGELLTNASVITETQLLAAVEIGLINGLSLGKVLVDSGFVDKMTLDGALAIQRIMAEGKLGLEAGSKALFKIFHDRLPLQEALKGAGKNELAEDRSLLQFLRLNKKISDSDVQKLISMVLKDSQVLARALVRTKVLSENTVDNALRCQQLWRRDTMSIEHASVAFSHAELNNCTAEEAFTELSWMQNPTEVAPKVPKAPEKSWEENKATADNHLQAKKYEEALRVLHEMIAMAETFPEHDERLMNTLEHTSEVHSMLRQYSSSRSLLRRAVDIKAKKYGAKHFKLATTLNNLAKLSYFVQDFDGAELYSNSYIEVLAEALGQDHPNVGAAHHNLATVFHVQKKYKEAEGSYTKAMTICQKVLGMNHPATVKILQDYAKLLRETHREDEAQHFDSCARGLVSGSWKTLDLSDEALGDNA
jgi:tetratricopeptide (TPR) repeat protein